MPGSAKRLALDDPGVRIWYAEAGVPYIWVRTHGDTHELHIRNLGTFRFTEPVDVITVAPEPGVNDGWLVEAYRRMALPLALQSAGYEVLHASAVVGSDGVVVFCGESQTGKSTMAHVFSARGYGLFADDALVFRPEVDVVQAIPLPFSVRLRPSAAEFFGLVDTARRTADDRYIAESVSEGRRQAPLAGIVVLERAEDPEGADVVRDPLTPAEALRTVMHYSSYLNPQDMDDKRRILGNYLSLTQRVPIVKVRFQPGFGRLDRVADRLQQVVEGLPGDDL